ncbi:MAG: flagellin FliC [Gammaproteobacteria bacterium]|nr:MAG: flagellin FliC [Gammaproteobacteria bacterium]
MAIGIFSNSNSLFAQKSLSQSANALSKYSERLASGRRINNAADDASGLAIAQKLSTFSGGLISASRNINDGISMADTASSAISSMQSNLQRMRELAIQAANGSYSGSDRASLQSEVNQLQSEISDIPQRTTFNGIKVLDSNEELNFQVGANAEDTINITLASTSGQMANSGVLSIDISTQQGAQDAISTIDEAIQNLNESNAEFGALSNRFESALTSNSNSLINSEASRSRIEDADYAKTISELSNEQIRQQASIAMLGQANANKSMIMKLLG